MAKSTPGRGDKVVLPGLRLSIDPVTVAPTQEHVQMDLSPKKLASLAARIQERRAELQARTHQDAEEARDASFADLAGEAHDPGDEASADLLSDLATADVTRDLAELRALDAAQDRIDAGTYGQCVDCGRAIPFERLQASLSALRCIDCQTVHERTFAQPGQSTL